MVEGWDGGVWHGGGEAHLSGPLSPCMHENLVYSMCQLHVSVQSVCSFVLLVGPSSEPRCKFAVEQKIACTGQRLSIAKR